MKDILSSADLILNDDGSIYHLALQPEELAGTILLVGDPKRVPRISRYFDTIEVKRQNREFVTHTGTMAGKWITVLSTGCGPDNIDIVMNELDALVNIDLVKRTIKPKKSSLDIIRLGTSGGLQPDVPSGSLVLGTFGLGLDGTMGYYGGKEQVTDQALTEAFRKKTGWPEELPRPYIVEASPSLVRRLDHGVSKGITATAAGFYAPQGRILRMGTAFPEMLDRIAAFEHHGLKVLNFEMETAALYGLGKLLGHQTASLCVILANRVERTYSVNKTKDIDKLIEYALEWITK